MKHFLSIIFIAAIAITTSAQSIDADRMHRDLEVAENALGTIIKTSSDKYPGWHFRDKDIEADFVKDYGVVFTVNSKSIGYIVLADKVKAKNHQEGVAASEIKQSVEDQKNHFIENCKMFLADYAGIIGQLNDDQKISIRRGGTDSHNSHINLENVYIESEKGIATAKSIWGKDDLAHVDSELTIEVSVGKINQLRRGTISRDDFYKAVNVVENVRSYEKDPDIETLVAMFQRLYKKDLSKTYYSERQPKYSKLSNFGVIIKMKFYSSYEDDNVYSMPTIAKKGLTLEERNNYVMELLPQFEADFRENLINYGRTMKNLDSDEILMFEINMTTCKDCKDFPRHMKFSVKKSVLHKFNRGELTMDQAVGMVNVDRIMK